jgi:signal transduction histidine kinase
MTMKGLFLARRPRWTVRLRLTLLYGSLVLVSAGAVVGSTYLLFDTWWSGGGGIAAVVQDGQQARAAPGGSGNGLPAQAPPSERLPDAKARAKADDLHQLLVVSDIAMGVVVALSVGVGWFVAGHVLRPIRTISTSVRRISEDNLHARLAAQGPADELKELSDTFDQLLQRLETAFEAQRQFAANASHELRTPLTLERTLLEVALADPDCTLESLRATCRRVLIAEAQQEQLIASLLTLARSQSGLGSRSLVDLSEVTRGVVSSRTSQLADAGLTIGCDLNPAPILGDDRLVEHLTANLLDNAIRYNVPAGFITLATGTADGRSFLTVFNSGPHISAEQVTRLQRPFERLGPDRTDTDGGTGLGLSIVASIARAHGAGLLLEPHTEGGLAVNVTFEQARPDNTPRHREVTSKLHSRMRSLGAP